MPINYVKIINLIEVIAECYGPVQCAKSCPCAALPLHTLLAYSIIVPGNDILHSLGYLCV